MRKTTIVAVAISSVLWGAVGVAAEPDAVEPTKNQATSTEARSTEATSNTPVGAPRSNVDEPSTAGDYYPNSAGTVGDDPTDPKSTAVSADTSMDPTAPSDQWGNLDTDADGKVTESECRAWYESEKKKDSAPSSNTPPDKTGN